MFAASEARAAGRGGIAAVSFVTGIARSTIERGLKDLDREAAQQHPDRDAQFQHINDAIERFQRDGQPALSVDTRKKELVGDFTNGGRELRRKASPRRYACMTSSSRARAGLFPMASTTLPPPKAGSASESTTTPPLSPSKASAAGGATGAQALSRRPPPAHHRRLRLP